MITWRFLTPQFVFQDSAQLEISFVKCFFSLSFRQSRLSLIRNLISKGNLKRKHLTLELFPEGGSSFYWSKFKLRYLSSYMRYCKTFFSFQLPFIRSFRKKKIGRFKNLRKNDVSKHDVITEYIKACQQLIWLAWHFAFLGQLAWKNLKSQRSYYKTRKLLVSSSLACLESMGLGDKFCCQRRWCWRCAIFSFWMQNAC